MPTRYARDSSPARRRRTPCARARGEIFRLEGEYWTIVYQGALCRLRDAKGLRYLAHLLSYPGQRFPVAGLAAVCDRGMRMADRGFDGRGGTAIDDPQSARDERARLAVTKRIQAAVKKIAQHHPALARHLIASIKTGYQCAYLPAAHDPIIWSV